MSELGRPLIVIGALILLAVLAGPGLLAAEDPLAAGSTVDERSSDEAIRRFAFAPTTPTDRFAFTSTKPPDRNGRHYWMPYPVSSPVEQAQAPIAAASTVDEARGIVAADGFEVLSARVEPELFRLEVRKWGRDDQRLVWRRDFFEPTRSFRPLLGQANAGEPVTVGRLTAATSRENVLRLAAALWSQTYGDWVQARLLSERVEEQGDHVRVARFTTMGIPWTVQIWRWHLECDRRDGRVVLQASLVREIEEPCLARRGGETVSSAIAWRRWVDKPRLRKPKGWAASSRSASSICRPVARMPPSSPGRHATGTA